MQVDLVSREILVLCTLIDIFISLCLDSDGWKHTNTVELIINTCSQFTWKKVPKLRMNLCETDDTILLKHSSTF